jgi:SAM-dependent methyltransferase
VRATNYADPFGLQWNRYRVVQLDSYTGHPFSRERLQRCGGEELWRHLQGAHVLEAGCGAGRFTEVLLAEGASVTSVDLSSAVEANKDNCPLGERHRIAQADILRLPFLPRQFDAVVCLGVVQHTPSSEETIAALYDQVKPGGWLVIDHYTYSLSYFTKSTMLVRRLLRPIEPQRRVGIIEQIVDRLLPLHKKASRFLPAHAVLSRLSPVVHYYRRYPFLSDRLIREWARLDTHDILTDYYKRFRTLGQIRASLHRLGLTDIACAYAGNGVEARGRRPLN